MRHRERGAVDIKTAALMVLLVIVAIGFISQLGFIPHSGADKVIWWKGLVQGFYSLPNLIFNLFASDKTLDVYQSGAGVWYTLSWFVGFATPLVVACAAMFGRRH